MRLDAEVAYSPLAHRDTATITYMSTTSAKSDYRSVEEGADVNGKRTGDGPPVYETILAVLRTTSHTNYHNGAARRRGPDDGADLCDSGTMPPIRGNVYQRDSAFVYTCSNGTMGAMTVRHSERSCWGPRYGATPRQTYPRLPPFEGGRQRGRTQLMLMQSRARHMTKWAMVRQTRAAKSTRTGAHL